MCQACSPSARLIFRSMASRREFLKGTGALAAASTFAATPMTSFAQTGAVAQTSGPADVIFHNGPIHTMTEGSPRAEAVAVRAGLISAVGTKADVLVQQGPGTRLIDLGGQTLLPGFIDAHMHSTFAALDDWLDVSPFTTATIEEALQKLRVAAGKAKPGDWVRAQGLDPSLMPGPRVTTDVLDAVAPQNPVMVLESNGHIAYANSKAFAAAGITRDTPNPSQGRYVRTANGDLSGRLEEPPAFAAFIAKMPMPSPQELATNIRRLFDHAASVGCTGHARLRHRAHKSRRCPVAGRGDAR